MLWLVTLCQGAEAVHPEPGARRAWAVGRGELWRCYRRAKRERAMPRGPAQRTRGCRVHMLHAAPLALVRPASLRSSGSCLRFLHLRTVACRLRTILRKQCSHRLPRGTRAVNNALRPACCRPLFAPQSRGSGVGPGLAPRRTHRRARCEPIARRYEPCPSVSAFRKMVRPGVEENLQHRTAMPPRGRGRSQKGDRSGRKPRGRRCERPERASKRPDSRKQNL